MDQKGHRRRKASLPSMALPSSSSSKRSVWSSCSDCCLSVSMLWRWASLRDWSSAWWWWRRRSSNSWWTGEFQGEERGHENDRYRLEIICRWEEKMEWERKEDVRVFSFSCRSLKEKLFNHCAVTLTAHWCYSQRWKKSLTLASPQTPLTTRPLKSFDVSQKLLSKRFLVKLLRLSHSTSGFWLHGSLDRGWIQAEVQKET